MESLPKKFELHHSQGVVADDTHRFRVINAGRRWGKDVLGVEEAIGMGLAHGGIRIPYIGPTIQQVRDIVWEPLKKRLQPITIGKPNESRLEINFHSAHGEPSRIVLRGWEAIETERGNKNGFTVMTEVAQFKNFWLYWQEVIRPTLTDLRGGGLFLSTPKGYNAFYDLYELQLKDQEFKSFHFTTYDNPFIVKEEIDGARRQMTEDRFAQEYLAEFKKMEGLVYKEFNRDTCLYDDRTVRPETSERLLGIDFGFTNPTAMIPIDKDRQGNFWVGPEWYKTEQTQKQINEAAAMYRPHVVYPDPAEPDRIAEMKRAGLNVMEVSNDIDAGINSVREMFRQSRLKIHKDNVNLISELETYHYPDQKPDKNAPEIPVDEDNHAVSALRYAIHSNAGMTAKPRATMSQTDKDFVAAMQRKQKQQGKSKKLRFMNA